MARLDAEARHALPERSFAYIDSQGGEHLPIHDAAHQKRGSALQPDRFRERRSKA